MGKPFKTTEFKGNIRKKNGILVILSEMELNQRLSLLLAPEEVFLKSCQIENFQSSGPGGQKKNRVKSSVRIKLKEAPLSVTASEHRETIRNKKNALNKLRLLIVLSYFTEIFQNQVKDLEYKIEVVEKIQGQIDLLFRKQISNESPHYPLVVFKIFQNLWKEKGELKKSSQNLGVSSSQMLGVLAKDKQAWIATQLLRTYFGKGPLKL